MIKYGFLIENNEIYDTTVQSYQLKREIIGSNIIHKMQPKGYKRLYDFEPLLFFYDVNFVFELLNFNSTIKSQREIESKLRSSSLHYMANSSVVYNYPPTYLKPKKFNLYKICQSLKKRLD